MRSYAAFWLYTVLRFALFFALWALIWLVGVPTLFAGVLALVLSLPLSWFLLARPRKAFAASIEQRVERRRDRTHDLDARLAGVDPDDPAVAADADEQPYGPGVREAPAPPRDKRR